VGVVVVVGVKEVLKKDKRHRKVFKPVLAELNSVNKCNYEEKPKAKDK